MGSNEYYEGRLMESNQALHEEIKLRLNFDSISVDGSTKTKEDVTISEDMMEVVSRHLTNTGRYKVQWSAISTGRQAAKMKGGNFEDLWLFEKQ